jgi:hypothetical protein
MPPKGQTQMKKKSITNETIVTMNWAEHDPRSVKAGLNGKGVVVQI